MSSLPVQETNQQNHCAALTGSQTCRAQVSDGSGTDSLKDSADTNDRHYTGRYDHSSRCQGLAESQRPLEQGSSRGQHGWLVLCCCPLLLLLVIQGHHRDATSSALLGCEKLLRDALLTGILINTRVLMLSHHMWKPSIVLMPCCFKAMCSLPCVYCLLASMHLCCDSKLLQQIMTANDSPMLHMCHADHD